MSTLEPEPEAFLPEGADPKFERYDDPTKYPLVPGVDTTVAEFTDRFVVYDGVRGPDDAVISGPISAGQGPGRFFRNKREAFEWAVAKYGVHRVRRMQGG